MRFDPLIEIGCDYERKMFETIKERPVRYRCTTCFEICETDTCANLGTYLPELCPDDIISECCQSIVDEE